MKLKKKQKQQLIYFILAVLWGLLIFHLSSIPDLSSGLPTWYDFVLRKLAHIVVFMILTYFIANSFDSQKKIYLIFIIFAAITYALIDEMHQAFVVSRSGNAVDIFIDAIGVYLGICFYKTRFLNKLLKLRV